MTVPTTLYPVLASVINRVREGETTSRACMEWGMAVATFLKHVRADPEMGLQFDEALQESYDRLAEKLVHIDEDFPDAKMAKVISGNIQWLLERRKPEGYGKRITVENTGSADKRILDALNAAIERIPKPGEIETLRVIGESSTLPPIERTVMFDPSWTDADVEDLQALGVL